MSTNVLPADPDGMNDRRADWAATAIIAFIGENCTDECDALADLLTDLMHWCDRNGQVFLDELSRATINYIADTTYE